MLLHWFSGKGGEQHLPNRLAGSKHIVLGDDEDTILISFGETPVCDEDPIARFPSKGMKLPMPMQGALTVRIFAEHESPDSPATADG